MLVRVLIALLASPWYGFLAVLATLPLAIIGWLGIGLIASVIPQQSALKGTVDTAVAMLILTIIVAILSILLQALIQVQMVRYAGAISRTIPLRRQLPFMKSYLRGLGIIVLFAVFAILVSIIVGAVMKELWDPLDLPALSPAEIIEWLARLSAWLDAGAEPGGEGDVFGWLLLAFRALNMLYTVLLALILVPIVCGISSDSGATWTLGYILIRIFVALPCCALMTAIIIGVLMMGVELFAGDWSPAIQLGIAFGLEGLVFMGMVFAFEAMMLRGGRELAVEHLQARSLDDAREPEDYRSLRKPRTGGS